MKDVSKGRTEEQKYIKSMQNKSQCKRYKSMSIIALSMNELNTQEKTDYQCSVYKDII